MGPLEGIQIIEMAGIGPGPFAGMLLADMGADVIRIDRMSGEMSMGGIPQDICSRGRRSISVNIKQPEGVDIVMKLIKKADALFEGFRPGVMEKLGLGPDDCLKRNPALVYGRITGWGQDGPLSPYAGHDINYISITGVLDAIGRKDSGPVPPLNLIGDYGGGAMYLVTGMLAALLEAKNSGKGQVVDAAICDGVISLNSATHTFKLMGMWDNPRQGNLLDGGAHFYDTYQCADGKWISIGSVEPQFFALLAEKLGVDLGDADLSTRLDSSKWPALKEKVSEAIKTKTQDEWCETLEGTDACFAPVLTMEEAPGHFHNVARSSFIERDGVVQSAPAPRFSRTPGEVTRSPVAPGADTDQLLAEIGMNDEEIAALKKNETVK